MTVENPTVQRKRGPVRRLTGRVTGRGDDFFNKVGKFLLGTLARTLAQGALFVLLAREMPIVEYGTFVGVTALITLISPFASLGAPSLIMQNYSDHPDRWASHLSRALLLSWVSGLAATALVVFAGTLIWGDRVGWLVLLGLALADLAAWRLIEVVAASVQARGSVLAASLIPALLHIARLAAAVILVLTTASPLDLGTWAVTSAVLSAVICLVAIWYGARGAGRLRLEARASFTQLRTGLLYAVGLSAQTVYNDIDKVILSRLSSAENAAIYAAAYRVIDFAYVPMRAMAGVAYPKFFEAGRNGPRSAFRLTRTLAPKYLLYTVPASLSLVAFAWVMPLLFGQDFAAAEFALQGLAALLVLKALHYLAADTLSGSRMQGMRSAAQVAVAVANAGLCLWLIPAHGWRGAVIASLACDALLAVLLWGALIRALRRTPPTFPIDADHTLRQSTNA